MAQIIPFEHWCTDGCNGATVLEENGAAQFIRRYCILVNGVRRGAFVTHEQATAVCAENGWPIDE